MKIARFIKTKELEELIRGGAQVNVLESGIGRLKERRGVIIGAKRVEWDMWGGEGMTAYMPNQEAFTKKMAEVGIDNDQVLTVVYDSQECRAAAKLSLAFRLYGKSNVAVLEGGLEKWLSENRKVETPTSETKPLKALPHFPKNPKLLKHIEYTAAISDLLTKPTPQTLTRIIDARSALRFTNLSAEPSGIKGGHIPGSKNLPTAYLYNRDMTLKSDSDILKALETYNIDLDSTGNIVHLSGLNFSAAYNFLALEEIGFTNQYIYDGGWTDWVNKYKNIEFSVSVKGILEETYNSHLKKQKNN